MKLIAIDKADFVKFSQSHFDLHSVPPHVCFFCLPWPVLPPSPSDASFGCLPHFICGKPLMYVTCPFPLATSVSPSNYSDLNHVYLLQILIKLTVLLVIVHTGPQCSQLQANGDQSDLNAVTMANLHLRSHIPQKAEGRHRRASRGSPPTKQEPPSQTLAAINHLSLRHLAHH